ncbi:MAG: hypothetical protein L7T24_02625 [Luminiphilus sp.]|nr:hypothetical protein [Luminiphilus sp.]
MRLMLSHTLAWLNFALLLAAVLKFIPLVYSLLQGVDLGSLPEGDPQRVQRAWALDLVSDTGYLGLVWFVVATLNERLVGRYRWLPWVKAQRVYPAPDSHQQDRAKK